MKKWLLVIMLYPLLNGCKKDVGVPGPPGPTGPAGPAGQNITDTGTITGTTYMFNEFSSRLATQTGVVVTLISGTTQLRDTTSASGQYQFHGIPTGTYNLTYSFPAFGTAKRYGISHFGGGNLPTEVPEVDLVQIPVKTAIDSMSVAEYYGGYVYVTITLDTSSQQYVQYYQNFLLLVGKTNAVGPTNYIKAYSQLFNPDGLGHYIEVFAESDIASFFNPGDTMYITACTYNRYLYPYSSPLYLVDDAANESFIDPATGYVIFPSARFAPQTLKAVY